MVLCDFKKATQMCHSFSSTNPQTLLSFFLQQSNDVWLWQCGMNTVWRKERAGECCGMERRQGLNLRVKRDERVGVWWLDGADVSVMAWCQTLCHCQC